jgi:hypothetical protein
MGQQGPAFPPFLQQQQQQILQLLGRQHRVLEVGWQLPVLLQELTWQQQGLGQVLAERQEKRRSLE